MKNNLPGQLEIVEAKEVKQSEKKKQRELIEDTIDKLSIIFDKVQKSKKYDRYIVADREKWGVVDSKGEIVIPLKFTRITSSNDTFFRVYGENSGIFMQNKGGIVEYKYQALYDYEGKELVPMSPYNKVISVGNNGLLFGFTDLMTEFNDEKIYLTYVGYDRSILKFDRSLLCGIVMDNIPYLIILINKDKNDYGLRVDKELMIKPLNEAYDTIELIDYSKYKTVKELQVELQISYEEANVAMTNEVKNSSNIYIGTINDKRYLLDKHYKPIKIRPEEKYKYVWS